MKDLCSPPGLRGLAETQGGPCHQPPAGHQGRGWAAQADPQPKHSGGISIT